MAARDERLRLEHVALGGGDEAEHRRSEQMGMPMAAIRADPGRARCWDAVLGGTRCVPEAGELARHTEMSTVARFLAAISFFLQSEARALD